MKKLAAIVIIALSFLSTRQVIASERVLQRGATFTITTPTPASTQAPQRNIILSLSTATPTPTPILINPETKTSSKKGVGMAITAYCAGKTDEKTCISRITNATVSLGATWYYDWQTDYAGKNKFGGGLEYVPMVMKPGSNSDLTYNRGELYPFIKYAFLNRGSYWLLFNEPDYLPETKIAPEAAARIFKQIKEAIGSVDNSPKFIVGGMLGDWASWATAFLNAYKSQNGGASPDISGWHTHQYTCGGYYSSLWRSKITNFRSWIDQNGGGEFWITEFGCLDYDHAQIIRDQLDWMETYSGIDRYAWFSASSMAAGSNFAGGNLFEGVPDQSTFKLSAIGQTYSKYPVNPAPLKPPIVFPPPIAPSNSISVAPNVGSSTWTVAFPNTSVYLPAGNGSKLKLLTKEGGQQVNILEDWKGINCNGLDLLPTESKPLYCGTTLNSITSWEFTGESGSRTFYGIFYNDFGSETAVNYWNTTGDPNYTHGGWSSPVSFSVNYLRGDYNNDSLIDNSDYNIWKSGFLQSKNTLVDFEAMRKNRSVW